MVRLRFYKDSDAEKILQWSQGEEAFYQWSAGVLGAFPVTSIDLTFDDTLMPFVAFNEDEVLGFFTLRNPRNTPDELRFGFVIISPHKRGQGFGKAMLQQGLNFAFRIYGAQKVSLGVFEKNLPAYHCYKSVGFRDAERAVPETYNILGSTWTCKELSLENGREIF